MRTDITKTLPKAIADILAACNGNDVAPTMAPFSPRARLNSTARVFLGDAEAHGFSEDDVFGDKVTMEVLQAWDRNFGVTIYAKMDGAYPRPGQPEPTIMTFYYTIKDGLITQFVVIPSQAVM
jgi:hypothetical protein